MAKTGFYTVNITPELSSYVKTDFSDLRVMDDKDKQVPYVIRSVTPPVYINSSTYAPLAILKNDIADSGKTILVIKDTGKLEASNLLLHIRNASVSRIANLSGSDDGKHWYSVIENISLQKTYAVDGSSYLAEIRFPYNNYRFLKLVIYNGKNDPLNIMAVKKGAVITYSAVDFADVSRYKINPACNYAQIDSSDGYTYIRLHNPKPYHVSRISIKISAPKFFKRDADVIVPYRPVANFTIKSDTLFNFYVPVFNSMDWVIKIFNGDNPPLLIKSITTLQEATAIVPYLEEGKAYKLVMSDANAATPKYDLQQFKDSIPDYLQQVKVGTVQPIPKTMQSANKSIFKKSWIWAVIIAILVGLIFFTTQLTKEVAKKKE